MSKLIFITHPEVMVDPAIDVRRWRLSAVGLERMRLFADNPVVANVTSIWSSTETKAIDGAEILAARLGIGLRLSHGLCENDRSSTGFLPPDEFEKVADEFFARPTASIRGWERAIDAQRRVEGAVQEILAGHGQGDVALVAHGAVGTLLLCAYSDRPISRTADQPFQGHYWRAELPSRTPVHAWLPIAPRHS